MPVICDGCGQRVAIPEGYRRNKIQCACGVICTVPELERQQADAAQPKRATVSPQPAIEERAERWLLDEPSPSAPPLPSEPLPFRDPEPIAESTPARKPAVAEMRFPCRRCRRLVRRQGECPDCDGFNPSQATPSNEEPVWWPSVDEPQNKEEEEDPSPYGFEGAEDVKCPKCCLMLPPGAVLCVRCGFHLKQRKKIARAYQPVERVWETTASYSSRLTAFWICEVSALLLGLTGVLWGGAGIGMFIFGSVVLTAMLAFLLGSFARIHLTRDPRGRVQLIKTWRVGFFALTPQSIDVGSYEGIVSGQHRDVSAWEYWFCFLLFVSGIIPGIIWWYLAIYRVTYHVSLSRDHGFPSYILYSGASEMQMREIAYALRDASGLPYDEG